MNTSLIVTRLPRPFDAELGAEARALIPAISGEHAALVCGAAGSSPYLKELIGREAGWLEAALSDPEAAVERGLADCLALPLDQRRPGRRQAERRVALITALA